MKTIPTWSFFLCIFITLLYTSSASTRNSRGHIGADSLLYQLWMRRLQTAPPISSPPSTIQPGVIQGSSTTNSFRHEEQKSRSTELLEPTENNAAVPTSVDKIHIPDQERWKSEIPKNLTNTTSSTDINDITRGNSSSWNTSSKISNLYQNSTNTNCLNISEQVGDMTENFPGNETQPLCSEEEFQADLAFQKACNDNGTGSWEGALNDTDNELDNATSVVKGIHQPCIINKGQDISVVNITSFSDKSELDEPLEQPTSEQATAEDLRNQSARNNTKLQSKQVQNYSTLAPSVYSKLLPTSQQLTQTDSSNDKPQLQNISRSTAKTIATSQSSNAKVIQNVRQHHPFDAGYNGSVSQGFPSNDQSNASISKSQQSGTIKQQPTHPYNTASLQTSKADVDFLRSEEQSPDGRSDTFNPHQQLPDVDPHRVISQRQPPDGDEQPSAELDNSTTSSSVQVDTQIPMTKSSSSVQVDTQVPTQTSFFKSNPSTHKTTNSGYMDRTPEYDPLSNRGGPFLRKPNAYDFLMMGQIATAKRTESQQEFREANLEAAALICGLLDKQFCRLSIGGRCC